MQKLILASASALALMAAASGALAQVSSQTLKQANNGHHIAQVKQVVTP